MNLLCLLAGHKYEKVASIPGTLTSADDGRELATAVIVKEVCRRCEDTKAWAYTSMRKYEAQPEWFDAQVAKSKGELT